MKLDDVKRPGYVGSMYRADDVELIDEGVTWKRGDTGHVASINKTGLVIGVKGSTLTLKFVDDTTKTFPKSEVERIPDEDEFDEARDPLDDIPAPPDPKRIQGIMQKAEDALTNAIFNDTALGKIGFDRFYRVAGSMMRAGHNATPKDAEFNVELRDLQRAFRTGGELGATFQGSKSDARVIAKAMLDVGWNAVEEGLDEKKVECSYCGRMKEKHSGSDAEPYCRECDKKMEKLRDAQHARYEKARKQDFEETIKGERMEFSKLAVGDRFAFPNISSIYEKVSDTSHRLVKVDGSALHGAKRREADWHEVIKLPAGSYGSAFHPKTGSSDEHVELPDGRLFNTRTKQIVEAIPKRLDFREYAALVRTWHDKQLTGALADIQKTLPIADKLDRDSGKGDEGGYYRDQSSVIRAEIDRRRKGGKREESVEVGVYEEAAYNALDEAKRKSLKGYWRTTERGHRIFIENGKITKGNPHVLKAAGRK